MKLPVAIKNLNLFKIVNSFLKDVENISNSNQFYEIIVRYCSLTSTLLINCRESRFYQTFS